MPNWVAVRESGRITAVDLDGSEPRIYVRLKADMRTKMRRLPSKDDYPPDLKERAVKLALHQAELFAEMEMT